jgi:stage V sporulation protein AA
MSSQQTSLYIKIEKNSVVRDRNVRLSDVAKMTGTDTAMIRQLKQMKIYSFPQKAKKTEYVQVMTSLKIIEMIQAQYPNVNITNEGEADFVIEYEPKLQPGKASEVIKTSILCILIFFGASFTIMAFNNDVGVTDVFAKFYKQITGMESSGITELEICYSIGLAVGIIVFFNHVGHKKITHDPTPIQIEMRKYETDLDTAFINNAERRGHCVDVD